MAAQTGFQSNTTIHAAFWIYKPDPAVDTVGAEIMVEINGIQQIESNQTHTKVWIYYAANTASTSQAPYTLEGAVAAAFMADMESLFQ